jgi:hypothetical protein
MDIPVSRSLSLCSFAGTRRQLYRAGSTSAGTPWPRARKASFIFLLVMKLKTMSREGTPLGLLNLPTYHRREAKESNCRFPRVTKVYIVDKFICFSPRVDFIPAADFFGILQGRGNIIHREYPFFGKNVGMWRV